MNKEHLALRNNFRVTKKFLIAKFDCTYANFWLFYFIYILKWFVNPSTVELGNKELSGRPKIVP